MSDAQKKAVMVWLFGLVVAVWAMGVISYAVYKTFVDVAAINAAVVSALSAVLGIPPAAAGLAAMGRRRWKREPAV